LPVALLTIALLALGLIKNPKRQVRSPGCWLSNKCLGFLLLDQYSHHIAHFPKTSLITENIAPKNYPIMPSTIALLAFGLIENPKVQVRSPGCWLSNECLGFCYWTNSHIVLPIAPKPLICYTEGRPG
jgi:hypothetical protein